MRIQKFGLSFDVIREKLKKFNNLDSLKRKENMFLLKTSISDITLFLNYYLYLISYELNIDIKPTDSLKAKKDKILFYEETFFNESEKNYLNRIEKLRNKLAHIDTFFPNYTKVKKVIDEFQSFIEKINFRVKSYVISFNDLNFNFKKIKRYFELLKDLLPKDKLKIFNVYNEQVQTMENLTQKMSNNISILRISMHRILDNIGKFCPFSIDFLKIISNYEESLLRNPIKLFNKYFEENSTCPNCLSKEITKEFSICKWIIAGETFIIKSFNPFKTIKIESNALSTWYACDISYNEPCIQCHMSQDEIEMPPPKGSYFCENCGFYYLYGKRTGLSHFYKIGK